MKLSPKNSSFIFYLIPSGCVSALKVPYLQLWFVEVFSTFKLANLALALVSTLLVVELIVNGPSGEDDSLSVGKSFKRIDILASPVNNLKSGTNLLILIKN